MEINFPEAFNELITSERIKMQKLFLKQVAQNVIAHDRAVIARENPTNRNLDRAFTAISRASMGIGFMNRHAKNLWGLSRPKYWSEFIIQETNRIREVS